MNTLQGVTFSKQITDAEAARLIEFELIYRCHKCKHIEGKAYHPLDDDWEWADFQKALMSEK